MSESVAAYDAGSGRSRGGATRWQRVRGPLLVTAIALAYGFAAFYSAFWMGMARWGSAEPTSVPLAVAWASLFVLAMWWLALRPLRLGRPLPLTNAIVLPFMAFLSYVAIYTATPEGRFRALRSGIVGVFLIVSILGLLFARRASPPRANGLSLFSLLSAASLTAWIVELLGRMD